MYRTYFLIIHQTSHLSRPNMYIIVEDTSHSNNYYLNYNLHILVSKLKPFYRWQMIELRIIIPFVVFQSVNQSIRFGTEFPEIV